MAYPNKGKPEVQPPALMEKKQGKCLNDYAEISIGGVVYGLKACSPIMDKWVSFSTWQ